jgi:hypothetical protein
MYIHREELFGKNLVSTTYICMTSNCNDEQLRKMPFFCHSENFFAFSRHISDLGRFLSRLNVLKNLDLRLVDCDGQVAGLNMYLLFPSFADVGIDLNIPKAVHISSKCMKTFCVH